MHTHAEKVCTAIFCLPATFFLDFVKIRVRPQGCVFPGTLCIVAEKRWSVKAQPPSLAKEPQCAQSLAGLFPALPGAGICTDHPHKRVAGGLSLCLYH